MRLTVDTLSPRHSVSLPIDNYCYLFLVLIFLRLCAHIHIHMYL